MQEDAVTQAKERFERARELLQECRDAGDNRRRFATVWNDFLEAANAVYSKLEQGSKGNGDSVAWFGRVKRERKTDPVPTFIQHARNSQNHGLGRSTTISQSFQTSMFPEGWEIEVHGEDVDFKPGDPRHTVTAGPRRFILVPVIDRGVTYHPPETHKGETIPDTSPYGVAGLMISHLDKIIAEAERRVGP